jgi:DNA mismatch endonuclease (patch repair protein)
VPKSRREYWVPKLERNRESDRRKDAELESAGYRVLVIRDCDFESKLEELARLVKDDSKAGGRASGISEYILKLK